MKGKTLGIIAGFFFCVFFFFWSEAMKVFGGYFYEYRPDISCSIPPTILETRFGNDFLFNILIAGVFGFLFVILLAYETKRQK